MSMIIRNRILNNIFIVVKNAYSECGGILGAKDNVICYVVYDKGLQTAKCSYKPDIAFLNEAIDKWQEQGIDFVGLFHTHFFGVSTLSQGDIEYIRSIIRAMPEGVDRLFFPIVLPESNTIIPYLATRFGDRVVITADDLQAIE